VPISKALLPLPQLLDCTGVKLITMHIDQQSEIRYLHSKIAERKRAFDEGMKKDMEFAELKKIFCEIKELEKKLSNFFEQGDNPYNFSEGNAAAL
jgi:hypothetical protein